MKSQFFKLSVKLFAIAFLAMSGEVWAQRSSLQYFRPNDQRGISVFEAPKIDTVAFDGVAVRVGGDFAMQFQALDQRNNSGNLVDLGADLNLPTANLNLDVQLLDGVRMHMRVYLSSRNHPEAWVKGGQMQIDKLDFIAPGFLEGIMEYTRFTVGLDEFNYGDAHFRRTDNARAIYNPFVGNYIMDAFSTEAFGEVSVLKNGLVAVIGLTNGKLNQRVVVNPNTDNQPSFYGKLGFDKQLNEDLRVRLTGSWYVNNGTSTGTWIYGGDRAGARYYNVLHTVEDEDGESQGTAFDPRFNPRFNKLTAIQINPFIKFGGLEFFGVFEVANGNNEITEPQPDTEGSFTQLAGDLLYRFGAEEDFYVGARYNRVSGSMRESATEDQQINRLNVGGGWFLSKNILTKLEYVQQSYVGGAWKGRFAGAEFNGAVIEAVIAF